MPYEQLIKMGRIRPYKVHPEEIQQLLKVSLRDLAAAARNLEEAPDWAYSMAYNAILQTSRALMLSEGYRPRGAEQHATVVEFTQEKLGSTFGAQVSLFDQMRRKRNRVIYEVAGLVSKREAGQAVEFAKKFVAELTEEISRQPGLGV